MGRRKIKDMEFPSLPVPIADFMLYHESDIRAAVKEARAEFCALSCSTPDGRGGKYRKTDKTGAAAVKLLEELPAVVLADGARVSRPEKWIAVLEAVKARARKCARPEMIFEEWAARYTGDIVFIAYSRAVGERIHAWIRYHILAEAREAGLVSFSDDEITAAIDQTMKDF